MKLFGYEIKPEVVTMWANIIGFMASLIFYFSVGDGFLRPTQAPQNPLQDSLIRIDAKLTKELAHLHQTQDSLLAMLHQHKKQLTEEETQVKKVRSGIKTTLKSDWDSISPQEQEKYANHLITHLKSKKK